MWSSAYSWPIMCWQAIWASFRNNTCTNIYMFWRLSISDGKHYNSKQNLQAGILPVGFHGWIRQNDICSCQRATMKESCGARALSCAFPNRSWPTKHMRTNIIIVHDHWAFVRSKKTHTHTNIRALAFKQTNATHAQDNRQKQKLVCDEYMQ